MDAMVIVAGVIAGTWSFALGYGYLLCQVCLLKHRRWLDNLWRSCAAVHQELWIFAGPSFLLGAAHDWRNSWAVIPLTVFELSVWWWSRDWPDENSWKRRRRKLAGAVARRGGRLVVVPEGASS